MYTKRTYRFIDLFLWTRFDTLRFLIAISVWVSAYYFLHLDWLRIPWTPLALIGTAVAFVIGFQNNTAYGRIWEARKIWGGIVNASRTFGMQLQDMITNEHVKEDVSKDQIRREVEVITFRHIAWMTALRHAMREPRKWETAVNQRTNREWQLNPPEKEAELRDDLTPYLSKDDLDSAMEKNNKQTALLYQQSNHLRRLKEKGLIWEFSFLELEQLLKQLFTLQGQTERIKNFPYPRQYATLNHWFMWIFVMLLPLALVPQFADIGNQFSETFPIMADISVWFSIPFYVAVAWIFHTMERIGRTGENPFEGTSNDVPISTISRGIEIDLRQNLGERLDDIPKQFAEKYDIQF